MSRILLNVNATTGVETYVHDNPDNHERIVETVYDRTPVLEHAKAMRNEVDQRGNNLRKIGSIPMVLYFQWMREGKLGELDPVSGLPYQVDPDKIRALLNSPEYSLLKTIDGEA